jgi:hypothetical protein
MLLLSAWSATTGLLKLGAEVTVELSGRTPFWATVVCEHSKTEDGDGQYTVEDEHGETSATVLLSCVSVAVGYFSVIVLSCQC